MLQSFHLEALKKKAWLNSMKNKVIIVVELKNEELECFVVDSYLLGLDVLTLKQGNNKRTIRLDLIKAIYTL